MYPFCYTHTQLTLMTLTCCPRVCDMLLYLNFIITGKTIMSILSLKKEHNKPRQQWQTLRQLCPNHLASEVIWTIWIVWSQLHYLVIIFVQILIYIQTWIYFLVIYRSWMIQPLNWWTNSKTKSGTSNRYFCTPWRPTFHGHLQEFKDTASKLLQQEKDKCQNQKWYHCVII